jgi:acetyl esterase/lipase
MPLHPWIGEQVRFLEQLPADASPEQFAAAVQQYERDPAPWVRPSLEVVDELVPSPGGPVPVRIYAPNNRSDGVITWIHGGAFMTGDLNMPEADMVAAELAVRTGAAVVSVGYRLAVGGVRYPVPHDDCVAAWRWVRSDFAPAAPRAVLGGASAGATLALGCALEDRDQGHPRPADALLMAYPYLHHPVPAPSAQLAAEYARELPDRLRFSPEFLDHVVRNYVGRIFDVPVLAIGGHADLRGLPPTTVVVAEYDDLRPSGELFARQFADAGGETAVEVARGLPHGFLNRSPYLPEVRAALDLLAVAAQQSPPS